MIRTFWKETGLDDKEEVSWIKEKKVSPAKNLRGVGVLALRNGRDYVS